MPKPTKPSAIDAAPEPPIRGVDPRTIFATKSAVWIDYQHDDLWPYMTAVVDYADLSNDYVDAQLTLVTDQAVAASDSAAEALDYRNEAEVFRDETVAAAGSLPDGTINDSITTLTDTWSSQKISDTISSEGGDKASFTASFSENEQKSFPLSIATQTPIVNIYKEVPQIGESNNDWSVNADGADYDVESGLVANGTIEFDSDVGGAPQSAWGYDSISLDVSGLGSSPADLWYDNENLYVLDTGTGTISAYDVVDYDDISASTIDSGNSINVTSQARGFTLNAAKTVLFVVFSGGSIKSYSLSTAGDLTTAVDSGTGDISSEGKLPQSVDIMPDGVTLYVFDNSTAVPLSKRSLNKYTLSVANDVSTISLVATSPSLNTAVNDGRMQVLPDESSAFSVDRSSDSIKFFTMSAGDVTTLTEQTSFSVSAQSTTPDGLHYRDDQRKILVVDIGSADAVFQYSTTGYMNDEYLSAITSTAGQIDTEYWLDINSMTASETLNAKEIYYSFSSDDKVTFKVPSASGERSIVRDNAGTWEYNSNATFGVETWTAAAVNTAFGALSDAMGIASNQLTGSSLAALLDSEQIALGDSLDLAVTMRTDNPAVTPVFSGMAINYDASTLNVLAINGTDYIVDAPDTSAVRVKALANLNLKGRII